MTDQITVSCLCGTCSIVLSGTPIFGAECHCASCRKAMDTFEALPGAPMERSATGGVPYVLWRKDRVSRIVGEERLASYRLSPKAKTRRVLARCCNAPMFLDFAAGHWISINAARFPADQRPPMRFRTMTGDRGDVPPLPDDLINARGHTGRFMLELLGAWVAMGFRNPPVARNVREATDG
jgi:hypothetical protein